MVDFALSQFIMLSFTTETEMRVSVQKLPSSITDVRATCMFSWVCLSFGEQQIDVSFFYVVAKKAI